MRTLRLPAILTLCAVVSLIAGCGSELQDLRIQNQTQQKLIDQLQADLETIRLERDRLKNQLDTAMRTGDIDVQSLQEKIAALE
ncbi:MAG: hypothetical protein ACYTDV_17000, partial [Planctomycetota bacterium]